MAVEYPNGSGYSRLDRMERVMLRLQEEHLKLQEGMHSLLELQTRFAESQGQVTNQIMKLTGVIESIAGIIGDIAMAQRRMEQELTEWKDSVRELLEAQKRTDERMNAFITAMGGPARRSSVQ